MVAQRVSGDNAFVTIFSIGKNKNTFISNPMRDKNVTNALSHFIVRKNFGSLLKSTKLISAPNRFTQDLLKNFFSMPDQLPNQHSTKIKIGSC